MADLDDFFAKKDRKKSKSKKFPTTEEVVKKLEDTSKTVEKPAKKEQRPAATVDGEQDPANPEEIKQVVDNDDEWKEFEKEKSKDYTGLKIFQLQINENNQHFGTDGEGHDGDGEDGSDMEGNPDHPGGSGPWKHVAGEKDPSKGGAPVSANNAQPANDANSDNVSTSAEKPSGNKVYVSPALRNMPLRLPKLKKGVAPDIKNEDYFPSLGAAKPEELKKKKREPAFEEVRHGSRFQRPNDVANNSPVTIGNRFNSLSDS